jgi:hypothetical protein
MTNLTFNSSLFPLPQWGEENNGGAKRKGASPLLNAPNGNNITLTLFAALRAGSTLSLQGEPIEGEGNTKSEGLLTLK